MQLVLNGPVSAFLKGIYINNSSFKKIWNPLDLKCFGGKTLWGKFYEQNAILKVNPDSGMVHFLHAFSIELKTPGKKKKTGSIGSSIKSWFYIWNLHRNLKIYLHAFHFSFLGWWKWKLFFPFPFLLSLFYKIMADIQYYISLR